MLTIGCYIVISSSLCQMVHCCQAEQDVKYCNVLNLTVLFTSVNAAKKWICYYNLCKWLGPTRLRSAVGNVSGNRCESDCRSRGHKFDPSPIPYFHGDWLWTNFYGHSPSFRWIIREGVLSVTSESMCTRYWLIACSSLPRKKVWLGELTKYVDLGHKATKQIKQDQDWQNVGPDLDPNCLIYSVSLDPNCNDIFCWFWSRIKLFDTERFFWKKTTTFI